MAADKKGKKGYKADPQELITPSTPQKTNGQPLRNTAKSSWTWRVYDNSSLASSTLRWFNRGFYLSILLCFVYILLHQFGPKNGEEVIYLSKEHLTTIQALLHDQGAGSKVELGGVDPASTEVPQVVKDYLKGVLLLAARKDSASFIKHLDQQLSPYNRRTLITALPNIPLKIPSFFWLTGALLYVEIIFWSLFGVAASVLYRASEAIGNEDFSAEKVPIHLAKILYAPLSTIIIIFSINLLSSDGSVVIDQISQRTIVLAFILGFFCGRTVELLRRVKDLILPYGADERKTTTATTSKKGSIKVQGRVFFPDGEQIGKKLSAVTVWLSSMEDDADRFLPVQADENGHFTFYHVKPGHYMLYADYSDEALQERYQVSRAILLNEEEQAKKIDLQLRQDQTNLVFTNDFN